MGNKATLMHEPVKYTKGTNPQNTLKALSEKAFYSDLVLAQDLSVIIDRWRENLIDLGVVVEQRAYDLKVYILDEMKYGKHLFGWDSDNVLELLAEIDILSSDL